MADLVVKRISRELTQVIRSEEVAQCGIKVKLADESFYELSGEIMGPPDTPYEGGKFELEIKIPSTYPFDPPEIRFATKIWHANISSATGYICLDVLKDRWSPSLTLRTTLLSLQGLLSDLAADDPQDAVVARQFQNNPEMFKLTALHWTNVYAGGPSINKSFDDKVRKMIQLGICEIDSRAILSSCDWDLENAIEECFSDRNQVQNEYSDDDESGDDESGDDESGDDESGDDESGDDESGDYESGDNESGDDESGDYESGDDESGDDERDDDRSSDDHSEDYCQNEHD